MRDLNRERSGTVKAKNVCMPGDSSSGAVSLLAENKQRHETAGMYDRVRGDLLTKQTGKWGWTRPISEARV